MVVVDLEASNPLDCGGRDVSGEAVLDSRVAVEPSPFAGIGDESSEDVHRVGESVGLDARCGQRDGFGVVPRVLPGVVSKAEHGNQGVFWRPVGEARDERCGVVRFATVVLIEERLGVGGKGGSSTSRALLTGLDEITLSERLGRGTHRSGWCVLVGEAGLIGTDATGRPSGLDRMTGEDVSVAPFPVPSTPSAALTRVPVTPVGYRRPEEFEPSGLVHRPLVAVLDTGVRKQAIVSFEATPRTTAREEP